LINRCANGVCKHDARLVVVLGDAFEHELASKPWTPSPPSEQICALTDREGPAAAFRGATYDGAGHKGRQRWWRNGWSREGEFLPCGLVPPDVHDGTKATGPVDSYCRSNRQKCECGASSGKARRRSQSTAIDDGDLRVGAS
jgi:hypothetical protein